MSDLAPPLHCIADGCHQNNAIEHRFCQACQTPLVHRYLRLLGRSLPNEQLHTQIGGRYWVVHPQWVLDLRPELPPTMPETIPEQLVPYLRLIPQRLHLPQIYGQLPAQPEETWLLEYNPSSALTPEQLLLPQLTQVWPNVDAYRQVLWLWQIARLWEPLATEGVASSLLQTEWLTVQGTVVQLQQLQADIESATLAQLGEFWQTQLSAVQPVIQPFFTGLVQQLQMGAIASSAQLAQLLSSALANLQSLRSRSHQLVAATDTGPTRSHNEDACAPQTTTPLTAANLLAIVCDGIGGHAGGEVASEMAIATVQAALQDLIEHPDTPAEQILPTLEQSILAANTEICAQNDQEGREERQRMGTTLVTTLLTLEALYHAHVGDSRLYWITRQACYRLTLDDDVAAREVRLGYALERDALSFPGGGSLVQALGMGPRIYPNLDRWVLDEDGVLLLCSDGLSDRDRVEQYWPSELLPILTGDQTLTRALERLIEIANTRNGHDNVTVALAHVQVQTQERPLSPLAAPSAPEISPATAIPASPRSPFYWLKTLSLLLLLVLGLGLLSYRLFPEWREQIDRLLGNSQVTSLEPTPTSPPSPLPPPILEPTPSPSLSPSPAAQDPAILRFEVETILQLPANTVLSSVAQLPSTSITLSQPTTFKIIDKRTPIDQTPWLKLQSCDPETPITAWLPEADAQTAAQPLFVANCEGSNSSTVDPEKN
ncbi:MAG: serine/threonine protein phosphatase [Spirulina sp. SIO3F2]|nr:serine/threonine protein phosphatase [Spirulina sp. SIO3F2]